MERFSTSLTRQEIRHGYSLLKLIEHLDRELNLLNQQRISAGLSSQEGRRLGKIRFSHLRKIQDCISELDASGFNTWLLERKMA